MAEFELEGCTLGHKRQHYNKLVQEAIHNNKTVDIKEFNLEDSDITNLMNIDIASRNRNVEYILKVLACDDMLYVSRAIKQSDWLINDQIYAHIINPKYLHSSLFPLMCSKAIIKLVNHIRNVLNDEKRGEEFYSFEENPVEAVKWLPCCSLKFIEENIINHVQHVKPTLLTRLCEKSINVLEIYIKHEKIDQRKCEALQANMFLLRSNTDKYLDLVEASQFPKFNKKATILLMKTSSTRVIGKFDQYYYHIYLPAFIRILKPEHIKDFLINLAQNFKENVCSRIFNPKRLLLFIRLMPQKLRFDFVKQVFIDKMHESKDYIAISEREREGMSILCNITSGHYSFKSYIWYQFAPFNIAFEKIQKSIESGSIYTGDKISMLETLLISTQNKLTHVRAFLEYLRDKHKNTEQNVREEILKKIILKNNFINYDMSTWAIIDDIFKGIDIYSESKQSTNEIIIESIIIYNIIHEGKVPEIVENKFNFNSLLRYHKKLDEKKKEIIFTYLHEFITAKFIKSHATKESEFNNKMNYLVQVLNLLKDYKKELESYPTIIVMIKDLIKTKNDLSLTVNMEKIFNTKKTWRKLLFEESLELSQTESALINALKHDPSLLGQNKGIVQNMLCNDKMTLGLALSKIKIFWPDSLAKDIIIKYREKLNGLSDHKATTRGLSILLPRKHLQEVIEKYTPNKLKIDWGEINEIELSVQQHLAKNMHNARPQPFPEFILRFAKGDYLQYALPSLLSIFYNLNSVSSQKYILTMLDAPVSLQKHGIRLAVSKMELEQLLINFSNIWKNNKNVSIRSVMFKIVFKTLCKEKDSNKIRKTWELMEMFIENLTFQEDKAIYKLLFKVKNVNLEVRARFYMKSYIFLHKLIHSGDQFEDYDHEFYSSFTSYSIEMIEELNPEFVTEIITEYINEVFTKTQTNEWSRGCVNSIISSFLLCANDDQTQLERYESVLLPILKQSFTLWKTEGYIRHNMKTLLDTLRRDIIQYVINKNKVIPSKMFLLIQEELQQALEIPENYMLLTKWKLTATFVSILQKHQPLMDWKETCINVAGEFGNNCYDYLREDCNKHFPRIYILFVRVLDKFLQNFIPGVAYWDMYKSFINDKSFIYGYLAAIKLSSNQCNLSDDNEKKAMKRILSDMCNNICEHPSIEVKMHYCFFKREINAKLQVQVK